MAATNVRLTRSGSCALYSWYQRGYMLLSRLMDVYLRMFLTFILGDAMAALDDSLLSLEKLDRTSPELWPEQIPGVSEFVSLHPSTPYSPQPWTRCLDQDDINLLHRKSWCCSRD
ncbi:hypothetical protein Cfor_12137 [Coptotermes formosanus]|uniref:Uncharacterized protein n=1 Tax=Coptotermes formosanus TaxID=36987 RepID=A0A6L2PBI2_COPFO|nr:hypothetical protein Cfor_12137 [Coptotermes formosanus]